MTAFGLLGGTFDPIHHGHLRLGEEIAEALGLDTVRFLPTGTPPHRGQPRASAAHRLAMARLAIAGNRRFVVDEHEIDKTTPCYMVDTLEALRRGVGAETPIVLILGADAFAGLEGWHQWRRLFDLCHFVVAERPGYRLESGLSEALLGELHARRSDRLDGTSAGRVFRCPITQLDISASALRARFAAGQSTRYLLPDAVRDYIKQHELYR